MKDKETQQTVIFSFVFILGGVLGIFHQYTYATIVFALGPIISSLNKPLKELKRSNKLILLVSVILGVIGLILGILIK